MELPRGGNRRSWLLAWLSRTWRSVDPPDHGQETRGSQALDCAAKTQGDQSGHLRLWVLKYRLSELIFS